MKKLLPYIYIALISCLSTTSCINEYFDGSAGKNATVELRLSMPSAESAHDGTMSKATSGTEDGSDYERTIIGEKDMRLFIFNSKDNKFIQEITDFTLIRFTPTDEVQVLQGKLPKSTLGKEIKIVMMANYASRDASANSPAAGQSYDLWKKEPRFKYGKTAWNPSDNKFIPMSGECTLLVDPSAKVKNYAKIQLKRAVAKVRIEMKPGCPYKINSVQTVNAGEWNYSLEQIPFEVPAAKGHGLYEQLKFVPANITATNALEFYITEQPKKQATLTIQFADSNNTPIDGFETIYFKDYPPVGQEDKDPMGKKTSYNIKRNHIYKFIINKKEDSKTDINLSIQNWVVHDIQSDYE